MTKKIIILLILSFSISICFSQQTNLQTNISRVSLANCATNIPGKAIVQKWMQLALGSKTTIGCPSKVVQDALSNLEFFSQQNSPCADDAKAFVMAFYSIFAEHPFYNICGLLTQEELFISKIAVDGKVCADVENKDLSRCFSINNIMLSKLKIRGGNNTEVFEYAKKIADSNDVTGISQLIVGLAYELGNGTDINLPLAIIWFKKSLERVNTEDNRINDLIGLLTSYEGLNNYNEAYQYARQCASLGDADCINATIRLKKLIKN
jgi:TPR repeat protein